MQKISKKLKICFYSALAVAVLSVILLTVSVFTAYDTSENYLQNAPLPIIFTCCTVIGVLFSVATLFIIPKGELSGDSPLTLPVTVASGFCAITLLIAATAIYGAAFDLGGLASKFSGISSNPQPLLVVCGILTLISVVYFVLNCFMTSEDRKYNLALVGFAVPVTAVLYVAISYFDISVSINAHIKILFHYSMISFMIWSLYELRTLIGKPMPRIYFAFGLITTIFSSVSSIPWLIGFVAGRLEGPINPSYVIYSLISLGVCVYTAIRLYVFVSARALLERIADQTEGVEDIEFEPIDEPVEEKAEESEEQ